MKRTLVLLSAILVAGLAAAKSPVSPASKTTGARKTHALGSVITSAQISNGWTAWFAQSAKFYYPDGRKYPSPLNQPCHTQWVPSVDGINYQAGALIGEPCRPFGVDDGGNHKMHFAFSFVRQSDGSYKMTTCSKIWGQLGSPPSNNACTLAK